MITSSQARGMAEATWGKGGTNAERTNRKGAFYYSCSSHGGFVIDARCLTPEELEGFRRHLTPEKATEIYDVQSGKAVKFRGPDGRRTLRYQRFVQDHREVEIFFAEEDCDWAVPVVIAGIMTKDMTREKAAETFLRWKKPTNHELLALGLTDKVETPAC